MIELLVVFAIIALRLSRLMPALSRVKQVTRKVICKSNLRNASSGIIGFASEHEGRFPGKADSPLEYWSPIWAQLVNREFYHNNDPDIYPTSAFGDEPTCGPLLRFWTFWSPDYYDNSKLNKKWTTCTEYKAWGTPTGSSNIWSRPWIMNRIANGGADWGGQPWHGQYGKLLPDPHVIHRSYDAYALGTRQEMFRNPSGTFLVWEGERGSDITHIPSDVSGGTPPLDSDPSYAPWTAYFGFWAFRHMLPSDRNMYMQSARANILYVDGHVGELSPSVPYALRKNYLLDG